MLLKMTLHFMTLEFYKYFAPEMPSDFISEHLAIFQKIPGGILPDSPALAYYAC